MSVTIKIGDAVRTMEGLKELDRRTVQLLSQFTFDESQKGAGRHNKTGTLFQSLYNRSAGPSARAVGHDTQRAPHAEFVLLGARPHDIRPKNKKALRWAKGGKFHFAKLVHHPGNRADPYLFQAGDLALRNFAVFVDQSFKELP